MCGICGVVDFSATVPRSRVQAMTARLAHRGPDAQAVAKCGPALLGHARLSIQDLSPTGAQPMSRGQLTVAYNGEIYNAPDLRRELAALGHHFKGTSDTEVLLAAWQEWGPACLSRFNGMFAVAMWDGGARQLHLARDRFGIKPLYWTRSGSRLALASEIKALLVDPALERRLDPVGFGEWLYYGTALGTRTLYSGIRRLLPGHRMVFGADGITEEQWFDATALRPSGLSYADAVVAVREELERAVQRHLLSDVPVGVFLSGGIDSSAIVCFAARHYGDELQTWSVGFDFVAEADERQQAAALASRLGTRHNSIAIKGAALEALVPKLVAAHDEPFSDAANLPLYLMCAELGGSVKVILQGDGGDEVFGGYDFYAQSSQARLLRGLARGRRLAGRLVRDGVTRHRVMKLLDAFAQADPALRVAAITTQERLGGPLGILTPAGRQAVAGSDPFARFRQVGRAIAGLEPVQHHLLMDMLIRLPDVYLEKVDKPTMAHGIEVRVPFLDAELAGLALSLPGSYKVRGRQKKRILRDALRGVVPDAVLDGPKRGFGVPYAEWLRGSALPWLRQTVLDPGFLGWGLVDGPALERAIDDHVQGRAKNGFLLYKLANLAVWRDLYGVG